MNPNALLQRRNSAKTRDHQRIESVVWRTVFLNLKGENVGRKLSPKACIVSTIRLPRLKCLEHANG